MAADSEGARTFVSELSWRGFYADVLWHRSDSAGGDLRRDLARLRYDVDDLVDRARWSRKGRAPAGHHTCRSSIRKPAATIRTRSCIQPVSSLAHAGVHERVAGPSRDHASTDPQSRWYRSLDLPPWQPPTTAFPVVWTLLYADIASSPPRP